MWYCVCRGMGNTDICYRAIVATKSRLMASILLLIEKYRGEQISEDANDPDLLFIKKQKYHYDRDKPQYKCPNCNESMTRNELDDNWDWGGPHCIHCGYSGLELFSAIEGPIICGRSER